MVDDNNAGLINLLDLAMVPGFWESAVVVFAVEFLRTLDYVKRHRVARTRKDIHFRIWGKWRHAKTDTCIIDRSQNDTLMLVQEDIETSAEVVVVRSMPSTVTSHSRKKRNSYRSLPVKHLSRDNKTHRVSMHKIRDISSRRVDGPSGFTRVVLMLYGRRQWDGCRVHAPSPTI